MSKAKLAAAHEFFHERQYDAARIILETMKDDPIAQEWLESIEQLAPKPKPIKKMSVKELLSNLDSEEVEKEILYRGIKGPVYSGEDMLPLLRQEIKNEHLQQRAISIIGRLDDAENVPLLVEILQKDIDFLKKYYRSDYPLVEEALGALRRMKNLDAEIALDLNTRLQIDYLNSSDPCERVCVAAVSFFRDQEKVVTVIVSQRVSEKPNGWELDWRVNKASVEDSELLTLAIRKAILIVEEEQDRQISELMDGPNGDRYYCDISDAFPNDEIYRYWADNH